MHFGKEERELYKMNTSVPLPDDDYSEPEHQACSYVVELMYLKNVLQYSKQQREIESGTYTGLTFLWL